MQPQIDDGYSLMQLLYTNGLNLKEHNFCVYLNSLHLKKKKEKDNLNPFLSFVRISKYSQMCKLSCVLVVSTLSTNYQHKQHDNSLSISYSSHMHSHSFSISYSSYMHCYSLSVSHSSYMYLID